MNPYGSIENWQRELYQGIRGDLICLARSFHEFDEPPRSYPILSRADVHLFPVGTAHRITKEYENIRHLVREACSKMDWKSIGVYRLGWRRNHHDDNPVVVFVRVSYGGTTVDQAKRIVAEISEILSQANMRDVHVHIAGEPQSQNEDDNNKDNKVLPNIPNLERCYIPNPTMGSSVSPAGTKHSGTLGFYVRVTHPNKGAYQAGITCHHVVQQDDQHDPFAPYLITPIESNSKYVVTCPSTMDHKKLVRDHEAEVKDIKVILGQLEEREGLAREGIPEFWNEYLAQKKTAHEEELSSRQERIAEITKFFESMGVVGEVVVSSGIKQPQATSGVADWALIRLDSDRFPLADEVKNKLPTSAADEMDRILRALSAREENQVARSVGIHCNLLRGNGVGGNPYRCLSDLLQQKPTARVFLYGRSSGATVGLLNGIRDDARTVFHSTNGPSKEVISQEYVVLDPVRTGLQLESARNFVPVFARSGDSGAAVMNEDGDIVGMLFAGIRFDSSGFGAWWVTPIEKILAGIEASLNKGGSGDWKVELL